MHFHFFLWPLRKDVLITDDYVLLISSRTCIFIQFTLVQIRYLSICFSRDSPKVARDSTLPSIGDIQVTNSADIHQMKVSLSPLICNLPSSQPETCNGNLESRSTYFDCIINLSGLCRWACAIGY